MEEAKAQAAAAAAEAKSGESRRISRPATTRADTKSAAHTPRPSPRTSRTRRVPHPVLIGHAASLPPYQSMLRPTQSQYERSSLRFAGSVWFARTYASTPACRAGITHSACLTQGRSNTSMHRQVSNHVVLGSFAGEQSGSPSARGSPPSRAARATAASCAAPGARSARAKK